MLLPHHDGRVPAANSLAAEINRAHLPALRSDGQPLPQDAHGYDFRVAKSSERCRLEKNCCWQAIAARKQEIRIRHRPPPVYAKSDHNLFNPFRTMTSEEIDKKFPLTDGKGDRCYDDTSHVFRPSALGSPPNLCCEWRGFRNPSGWTLSKSRLEEEHQKGNFAVLDNGKLQRRKYLEDHSGMKLSNLWDDIKIASGSEKTGDPTQKPLALLNRIIRASSDPGTVVLDRH